MRQAPITQLQTILTEPSRDESQLGEQHPLAPALGVFKDDPMLDAMWENILEQRRRDEEEAQRED